MKVEGVMSYKVIWEPWGVYCKYYGQISVDETFVMLKQLYRDARFVHLRYRIVDFLDIHHLQNSQSEINKVIAINFAHDYSNSQRLSAYVLRNVDEDVYENLDACPEHINLFTNETDAREWLVENSFFRCSKVDG